MLFACVMQSQHFVRADYRVSDSPYSGGDTTVFNSSRDAFAKPLANLPTKDLRQFAFGNKIFNTNWVQAPASVTSLDGLGPTFNRVSCSGCHTRDGRGKPPKAGAPMKSMLMRLSIGSEEGSGAPIPHPHYGLQLNPFAIGGVLAEGKASVTYDIIHGTYADGTAYTLRKPIYQFSDMAFGELDDSINISPRVAPAVHGLGLLEAIPEATILSREDPDDHDNDGISGRANHVPNLAGEFVIGRFGWKANTATLRQQDADAAIGDMGITTSIHPNENCPTSQIACQQAVRGNSPDMSDKQLAKLVFYSQTLAPPARRYIDDLQIQRGAELFATSQCSACHTPQITTGEHDIEALSNQTIQPFTDLLLHDMGDVLADNRTDYAASGNEWRTPPLWGIGLVETVNKHTNFLHDGRARNLEEAILWHGGEAEHSKELFRHMNLEDRKALIAFLKSL